MKENVSGCFYSEHSVFTKYIKEKVHDRIVKLPYASINANSPSG